MTKSGTSKADRLTWSFPPGAGGEQNNVSLTVAAEQQDF